MTLLEKKALEKTFKLAISAIEDAESTTRNNVELSSKTKLNAATTTRAKDELLRILGVLQIIPVA